MHTLPSNPVVDFPNCFRPKEKSGAVKEGSDCGFSQSRLASPRQDQVNLDTSNTADGSYILAH